MATYLCTAGGGLANTGLKQSRKHVFLMTQLVSPACLSPQMQPEPHMCWILGLKYSCSRYLSIEQQMFMWCPVTSGPLKTAAAAAVPACVFIQA